jgi:hypothetical protein
METEGSTVLKGGSIYVSHTVIVNKNDSRTWLRIGRDVRNGKRWGASAVRRGCSEPLHLINVDGGR